MDELKDQILKDLVFHCAGTVVQRCRGAMDRADDPNSTETTNAMIHDVEIEILHALNKYHRVMRELES